MDPHGGPVEDQSIILLKLETSLIIVSTVFLLIRLYSQLGHTKNAGLDDVIAAIAWVFICTQSSLELVAAHHWKGRNMWTLSPTELGPFFSHLPKLDLLFFVGIGIVRLSIVAFLPRLNKTKSALFNRIILGLATAIIAVTPVFSIVFLTSCRPLEDIWHQKPTSKCPSFPDQTILLSTHQALGAIFDLCLLCVPIWLVYTYMTLNWRTVKVMLVFGVGLFVFAVGIVRFVIILKVDMIKDSTWNIVHISIWSALEIHVGFWIACFPAFVPLIRWAYNKFVLGTSDRGSLPIFNTVRNPAANPRKKPQGSSSTGEGTVNEDGIMTNADGTVRTSVDLELADVKTWTDVRVTTNDANDDVGSHTGPIDLQSRIRPEPV